MRFTLTQFGSDVELANAVAAAWLDEVEPANRQSPPLHVALSGGRIARQFFAAVAEQAKRRRIPLDRVHFFWADERCVPPTDPECNFAIAQQILFEPLGISTERIHRVRGEDAPEQAAAHAIAEIKRIVPDTASGQPVLDFVLLGMGEDGHIASLFPGESDDRVRSAEIYRAVVASKPPPQRITLGYPAIAAARQVWVLASGKGKEQALQESLRQNGKTPLAKAMQMRTTTKIFSDIGLPG
jgi:6-phosphogluconolactonase